MAANKSVHRTGLIVFVGVVLFYLLTPSVGFTYQVPPLPADNLIFNPWFRSSSNPVRAGSDGWTLVNNNGHTWGLSQKTSNPTPEIIVSGECGFQQVYCGTGARWAHDPSEPGLGLFPNIDVYMYQIVEANPDNRRLVYFMHFVNHKVDVAEVIVYASDSAAGPWEQVWLPVTISQDKNPPLAQAPGRDGKPWYKTDFLVTTLERGYAFYKIELHARYPEADAKGEVGVKVTGIYFSAQQTEDPASLSTPVVIHNPSLEPSGQTNPGQASTPAPTAVVNQPATETPEEAAPPAPPATQGGAPEAPPASATPAGRDRPTAAPAEPAPPQQNGLILGFLIGLASAGVLAVAIIVFRLVGKK